MKKLAQGSVILLLIASLAVHCAVGSDFVPIKEYRDRDDSPFPEFGFLGTLVVEDFETGKIQAPGLSMTSSQVANVQKGFSVQGDSEDGDVGFAYEVTPTRCATTFPPSCPASVTIEFDETVLRQLPTYFGFVWTDAVRSEAALREPIALITLTDGNGEKSQVRRINELPFASELKDAFADDTLISFLDDNGISKVEVTVVTDGLGLGGHMALDHIQYGVAAKPGDADVDGDVDFVDFLTLSKGFGQKGEHITWRDGDFNLNQQTDFPDFLSLSLNFGAVDGRPQVETDLVPEPNYSGLLLFPFFIDFLRRRYVRTGKSRDPLLGKRFH